MRWKCEKLCSDIGLDVTHKKEIRRIYDVEKQRRRTRQKNAEKYGISIISADALCDAGYDVTTRLAGQQDIYDEAIKDMALQYLHIFLGRLSVDDRCILMSLGILSDREIAKQLRIAKSTVQYRRRKLIKLLKKWYQQETIL